MRIQARIAAIVMRFAWGLLGLASAPETSAEEGVTNIINGVISNYMAGTYMVGANGGMNALIVTNGGVLTAFTGLIGKSGASSNNYAVVTGAGSFWTNDGATIVGSSGVFNQLLLSAGGQVASRGFYLGQFNSATSNSVLVTGTGSILRMGLPIGDIFAVGYYGSGNSLIISNGGQALNSSAYNMIGRFAGANNNAVLVTGAGSLWSNTTFQLGYRGASNSLTIADGAKLANTSLCQIGYDSSGNSALVTGSGSLWQNGGVITIGYSGSFNRLTIANDGEVSTDTISVGDRGAGNQLTLADGGTLRARVITIGVTGSSTGNIFTCSGGSLYASYPVQWGTLDVHHGAVILNSGTVAVDRIFAINGSNSVVSFNGGLLSTLFTTVSNGTAFVVGDSVRQATYDMLGGTHSFADGLCISSNANLTGSGAIEGSVTNFGGIAPGHSAGYLAFSDDLTLMESSVLAMEVGGPIAKNYDRIHVGGLLRVGGLLQVNFTTGYTPDKGTVFDLFNYGSVSGEFSQTNLPAFQYAETDWDTSHLLADPSDPLSGSLIFVPEPSTSGLLLAGVGALWLRQRRAAA